ncbi:MAG: hypothetical protein ACRCZI_07580, partial [Cetobacterium sp.]
MYLFNEASKALKSCCKNKVTLTTAAVVSFLINGTLAFGGIVEGNKNYVGEVNTGDIVIQEGENLTNKDTEKFGVLNIWEDPKSLDSKQVSVINNATIEQVGIKGSAIAAVNIANAADFTNGESGKIIVNKNDEEFGTAISKMPGNINALTSSVETSSTILNAGNIDMQKMGVATAIGANGYADKKNLKGEVILSVKDETTVTNSGSINIHDLSIKTITGLEKIAWNLVKDFKITAGAGSVGNGILVGDNVTVNNTGNINITNDNAMTVEGTIEGVERTAKFAGVGIGAAHDSSKGINDERISVKNSGDINLNGNHFIGIGAVGDVAVTNSGNINLNGAGGVGVILTEGATLENSGTIKSIGEGAYAILSVGDVNDTVKLTGKSHVEGLIDLAAGNDTLDIDGVGTTAQAEKIEVKNIESVLINNSFVDLHGDIDSSGQNAGVYLGVKGQSKLTNYANIKAGNNAG